MHNHVFVNEEEGICIVLPLGVIYKCLRVTAVNITSSAHPFLSIRLLKTTLRNMF
jgi:hypothetical protein